MPNISGMMVDARAQVRMTTFVSVRWANETFFASFGWT
jgi:hypothetical protein